jgi:hypothetical protein
MTQTARNVFPTSIPAHRSTAAQIISVSFRAGEQPTSSQIFSSSARLLHSGIPYVGLTSFGSGFDCSIMETGRLLLPCPQSRTFSSPGMNGNAHKCFGSKTETSPLALVSEV